ncbi:MAG: MBL fold metallo-hydrolase, partial [Planctomycetes bacterium]|nr:MBL fold metallo-hydrolase [Planctomycetota bacterium]
ASLPCNVFLAGTRRFVIVDPGPRKEASRRRLMSAVERRLSAGDRLEAVVLTHHHHDHVGALDEVVERFGAPVWAHAITGRLIQRDLDRALDDGDEIDLGDAPDGSGRQALRCIFTPGHAEGHLALHETRYGALIAGDLVSTLVGMYVGSPGGHLATYFESIERVRRLGARLLFPSHGIPTLAPDDLLERTLEHARRQLDSAREQLTAAPLSVAELARRLHDESRPELRPMYERSTRARLEHLAERGEALRVGEDLYVRGGPVGDESG